MEKDLSHNLETDLQLFRDEITELIEDEIMRRYFYEEGALAWAVKEDKQVLKAMNVLSNKDQYSSILQGKSGSLMLTTGSSQQPSGSIKPEKPRKGISLSERMVAMENI